MTIINSALVRKGILAGTSRLELSADSIKNSNSAQLSILC
jgi:hypothetical protein